LSVLSRCLLAASLATVPAAGRAECVTRPMRITFYTCAEGSRECLTKQGNQPMPFRTVAVGDPHLLGRWLYIEDLGGWVLASDSGAALQSNSVDVFIGDARMARHARRLGVQHWDVRWCDASSHSSASSRLAAKRPHPRARPRTRAPRSRLEPRIARRPAGSAR